VENKKNGEFKTSLNIIGSSLKSSFKKHKVLWGIGIAILIVAILFSVLVSVMNREDFILQVADKLIPTKLQTVEESDLDMVFYREMNPEYENSDTKVNGDNYIQIYRYYYLDSAGDKQYLTNGEYHYVDDEGNAQTSFVALGFIYQAGERLTAISNALTAVKWILIAGFVVALIVLWYFKDKKRNEENKPKRIRKADNKNK